MNARSQVLAALAACVLATGVAHAATGLPRYIATPLSTLGGLESDAYAINQAGDVTGLAAPPGSAPYAAFLHHDGRMSALGPSPDTSYGVAINSSRDVVVRNALPIPMAGRPPLVMWYATIYRDGQVQRPFPDNYETTVDGINDAGMITGTMGDTAYRGTQAPYERLEGLARARGINAAGAVVGSTPAPENPFAEHAVIADVSGNLHDLGTVGTWSSSGAAISDKGHAAGSLYWTPAQVGDASSHAFLWDGRLHDLGPLNESYDQTRAEGINDDDVVVGVASDPRMILDRAFVYAGGTMVDLTSRVVSGLGNAVLIDAPAINNAGQIAATGCSIGICQAFRLDPVAGTPPPPAPVTMVEYHHEGFDHYFMTSLPAEIEALDRGDVPGWARTGESFQVYPAPTAGAEPLCRLFNAGIEPSSHFYAADPNECLVAQFHPGWTWQLEGIVAWIPVPHDDACAAGTVPVFRLYNNGMGGAPNHRYTTRMAVRSAMIAQGWTPEGYGAQGVIMCAPG